MSASGVWVCERSSVVGVLGVQELECLACVCEYGVLLKSSGSNSNGESNAEVKSLRGVLMIKTASGLKRWRCVHQLQLVENPINEIRRQLRYYTLISKYSSECGRPKAAPSKPSR